MSKITCEICGVKTCRVGDKKRIFMAKFPLNEDRCKQWVKATGKEDLVYVPIEKLHQLKYICEKHFRSKDFKKKKTQLRKNAIPSIQISSTPLPDEILVEFPLHIDISHKVNKLANNKTDNQQEINEAFSIINQEHTYTRLLIIEPKPSTSTIDTSQANLKRSFSPVPSSSTSNPSLTSTKKRRLSSPTPSAPSRRHQDILLALTLRKRKLLQKLKTNRIKLKNLQHKIDQIENISSPALKTFIESSIANQSRKPKGKGWTKLNNIVARNANEIKELSVRT